MKQFYKNKNATALVIINGCYAGLLYLLMRDYFSKSRSGKGWVVGECESGNEPRGSIKCG